MTRSLRTWLVIAAFPAVACQGYFENPGPDVATGPDLTRFAGAGVGEACSADDDCRDGLACEASGCAPLGDRLADEKCLLSDECADGLNCGWSGFCAPEGSGLDECASSSDCPKGQYCRLVSVSGTCASPSSDAGDLGAPCETTADCLAGLACSFVSKTCVAGAMLLNPDLYIGTACPDESAEPFGVRMALPGSDANADFYSLPFPSDVRLVDGRVDLSGHPVPGPGSVGFDLVAAVVDALEAEADGFSVYPLVLFRFTRPVDPATLTTGGANPTLRLVELPSGDAVPFTFSFAEAPGKYACGHRLALRPTWSRPLKARTTYAAVVTRGVRSLAPEGQSAEEPEALDDLPALLSASAPAEAAAKAAWQAYAPLRAWLGAGTVQAEAVAGATVFTTGDPTAVMKSFPAAAAAAPAPKVVKASVTVCQPGTRSPCATPDFASTADGLAGGADPRDCPKTALAGFYEVHLKLTLPVYQNGERPYLREGGALNLVDGKPVAVGTEEVCAAVTVPSGAMPPSGWPLVLYAHGTSGSFRTGAATYGEIAADWGVATLAIDQPMHGDRRSSTDDPGPLFYNYANPQAAKGNLYQGAADNFALLRFAKAFDDTLGAAGRVAFDDDRLVYMGHSQGATTGPLFLPYADELKAAVLTGAGGSLVEGLLGKEKPYNASVGMRVGLQEIDLDAWHPVLALIEHYFDATEPALYAPLAFAEPVGEPLSVLNVVGWDDHYSPWRAGVIFAASLGGAWAVPDHQPADLDVTGFDPETDLGLEGVDLPAAGLSGNITAPGGKKVTGASVAHVSNGTYDGHFVGARNEAAARQIANFLGDVFASKTPRVVE